MTDEIFVIDGNEMEEIRKYAHKVVDVLPNEPKTALMVIAYVKGVMEDTLNVTSQVRIKYDKN